MDLEEVFDDLIELLYEHTWYKTKDEVHANKAIYFTLTWQDKEFDVSIKDSSLREGSK